MRQSLKKTILDDQSMSFYATLVFSLKCPLPLNKTTLFPVDRHRPETGEGRKGWAEEPNHTTARKPGVGDIWKGRLCVATSRLCSQCMLRSLLKGGTPCRATPRISLPSSLFPHFRFLPFLSLPCILPWS
jgi:hypothetical protein